jgi:3-hydroxyisobutyrate dehydrogenase-like beta-hydroxyacid dehydrogenase
MVGGGCRGLDLARSLASEGHAVRVVTRRPEACAAIEAAGAECFVADPDVVGTLRYALEGVTVLLWLLATATGPAEKVTALHGSRLRMMLSRTTDTTVRGVVYEAAGTVGAEVLAAGVEEMRHARRTNEIPYALLETGRADGAAWVAAARAAIDAVLTARRSAAA